MLLSLSGRDGAAEPGLDALLAHLGGHTLAVELAGAYLATYPSTTATTYLSRLQAGTDLSAKVTPQVAYARTVEQSLSAIWERLDEPTRRAWQLAGVFAPAEATLELLTACGVDEDAQRILRQHHLITTTATRWTMHRLVRAYGARAGTDEERTAAQRTFLDAVVKLVRNIDAATGYRVYRENLPHLDHALALGETVMDRDEFGRVLDLMGIGAYSAGELLRAKELLDRALQADLLHFGEDGPRVTSRRSNLAVVLRELGDLPQAKSHFEAVLASDIRRWGEEHSAVAMSRSNLALVLQDLGDVTQAKQLLESALAVERQHHGEDSSVVATSRSNLAGVLQDLGELVAARKLLEEALRYFEKEHGDDHQIVATCRANLASVLHKIGDVSRARELLERAIDSSRANLGEDHPSVATFRSNFAMVLKDLGDLAQAKDLLNQALASDLRNFPDSHPGVASKRSNLALVLAARGDLSQATTLLELALESGRRSLGEGHWVVAKYRANLALVLKDLGDLPRAKELLEQSIDAARKKLGDEHPNVITYRMNLAEVVKRMNAAAAVSAARTESKEPTMTETHDVFICHASEDKARFVEPLVAALVGHGLRVWYDRFEIGLGDDVRAKMNEGLRGSRFGVVLVSPSSSKFWPQAELGALFNQEARGTGERPRILPVRCDLSVDELTARDPLLAGRRSIGWEEGLDAVARAIVGVVERARAGASAGAGGTAAATSTPPRPAMVAPVTPGSPPVPTSSPATAPRWGGAAGRLDLGLVIALSEELRQVLALVGDYTRHPSGDLDAYLFTRNGYRCAAVLVGEMGQTQAGVFTERFIAALDPAMIVSMGIAGGLNDLCAGDVHVPSQSVEYLQDAKAAGVAGGGFAIVPGAPAYRVDYALLRAARALEFDHPAAFRAWRADAARDLAALLPDAAKRAALLAGGDVREEVVALADGHVATGPVVGAARAFADWIRSHDRNVKSLEMEASAVVLAATTRPDPRRAFILRAISDLGDERKKDLDGKSNGVLRRWAMNNAVRYLWTLLDVGALPRAAPAGTTDA
ncbi:MAG: tetratricopeptide repeat protein [Kofleriaceae bacterium]|nr:tetratricopeptide repeat protein [Kofleriaceae bacterium]MBP9170902.1 tetratricopeptide repeat protein [Kofleriaceae bacterium]MBP9861301.1 tetratricopeptide repeat protein [Kofleriaceae bacterium]